MTQAQVDVVVVAYASDEALASCLRSIVDGSLPARPIVIDNAPGGGAKVVAASLGAIYWAMARNVGFCAAVNRGIELSSARYVMLANPDARVSHDYVARLVGHLEDDPSLASVGGRILRGGTDSTVIDSLGIAIEAGRRPVDVGHGWSDVGPRLGTSDVFGVTAAAAIYRRSALDAVRALEEVLPEDFFMYMDDVDLAWRLRLAGYRSLVDHAAVAWHDRASAGGIVSPTNAVQSWLARATHESRRPDYVRSLSAANHLLTIVRNDDSGPFLTQWPRFAARRMPADGWMAAQRPGALIRSRARFFHHLPRALTARREIQRGRVVSAADMARWLP